LDELKPFHAPRAASSVRHELVLAAIGRYDASGGLQRRTIRYKVVNHPLEGVIKVSSAPMLKALELIGN
jgi:hypothetical protein